MKLNIYLTDLADFPLVNEVMAEYFDEPYPRGPRVGVASLPKGAAVEVEASSSSLPEPDVPDVAGSLDVQSIRDCLNAAMCGHVPSPVEDG